MPSAHHHHYPLVSMSCKDENGNRVSPSREALASSLMKPHETLASRNEFLEGDVGVYFRSRQTSWSQESGEREREMQMTHSDATAEATVCADHWSHAEVTGGCRLSGRETPVADSGNKATGYDLTCKQR